MSNDAPEGFCPACMLEGALQVGAKPLHSLEAESEPSLPQLGDYQLLEEIARGGMGVVYRARQVSLDRVVAVKLILVGQFADKSGIKRFKAEASAAAKLRHPSIVAIHETGEESGNHFFSMEYVEGHNLADFMRQQPISIRQAAQFVKKIAEAVHYAHEQGIVHRDLKPSNILIDGLFEPRITDFGLARDLKADGDLTLTGQVLGSPNYISPEQASGNSAAGIPSDIYSLGAILYHLLTGRPPFAAETLTATLHQVTTADPVSPRILNPSVPRDLETICLKCLEKEPSRRYHSAQVIADELNHFLNDEPIHARPISAPAKAWRWCRRKPVVAGLAAAFALSLLLGFIGIAWQWRRAERNLYFSTMGRVQEHLRQESIGSARILLERYVPKWWNKDLRGWEWYYAWDQCQNDELFSFTNKFWISSIASSPDGAFLAAGGAGLTLWDIEKRTNVVEMDTNLVVNSLTFRNSGKEIIGGTSDGRVLAWNLGTRQMSPVLTNLTYVRSLKLSPNGKFLALYTHAGVTLWDAESYERLTTFGETADQDKVPGGIAFSPDSRILAYSRVGGKIVLFDIEEKSETVFEGHELNVTALVFSADGSILVSGSRDRSVRVWEVKSGKMRKTIVGFVAFVLGLDLSRDGTVLAVVGAGQNVRVFDTGAWQQIHSFVGHTHRSLSVIFRPGDGKQIISANLNGEVKFWPAFTEAYSSSQHFPVAYAEMLQGGTGLYLKHTETNYSFWHTEGSNNIPSKPFPSLESGAPTMSPDGKLWAIATTNQVKIFNHETNGLILKLPFSSTGGVGYITFSADSRLLAICGNDYTCRVWKLNPPNAAGGGAVGLPLGNFQLRTNSVWTVKFSPENRLFGVTYKTGEITDIWNIASKKKVELRVPGGISVDIAFPRDESIAVTTAGGGALVVWDPRSGRMITFLGGQLGTLWSVDFSPDETRIAACGGDGTVRIWDRATLQEVAALSLHTERLWWLAFSETGERLFALGPDLSGGYRLFTLRAPKVTTASQKP